MRKNEKGITLIALVITIIVLLILAGVSIAMLRGDNGIVTNASNAKTETLKSEAQERLNLAVQTVNSETEYQRVTNSNWDPKSKTETVGSTGESNDLYLTNKFIRELGNDNRVKLTPAITADQTLADTVTEANNTNLKYSVTGGTSYDLTLSFNPTTGYYSIEFINN